jgi:hypothetical protein
MRKKKVRICIGGCVEKEVVFRAEAAHEGMPRHPGTEQEKDQGLKSSFRPAQWLMPVILTTGETPATWEAVGRRITVCD